jgi:hypothetical protein
VVEFERACSCGRDVSVDVVIAVWTRQSTKAAGRRRETSFSRIFRWDDDDNGKG